MQNEVTWQVENKLRSMGPDVTPYLPTRELESVKKCPETTNKYQRKTKKGLKSTKKFGNVPEST